MKSEETSKILETIEFITMKVKDSELSDKVLEEIRPQTELLSKYLECNDIQSVLFSIILSISFHQPSVDISDLSNFLNLFTVNVIKYIPDLEVLIDKRIIKQESGNHRRIRNGHRLDDIKFYVPPSTFEFVKNGKSLQKTEEKELTIYEVLDSVENLLEGLGEETLSYNDVCLEIRHLVDDLLETPLSKKLRGLKLRNEDLIILLYLCSQITDDETSINLVDVVKTLIPKIQDQIKYRKTFIYMKNDLIVKNLVRLEESTYKNDKLLFLTENGVQFIFGKDKEIFLKTDKKRPDFIKFQDIPVKNLYYNQEERKNLEVLTDLLKQENFRTIQERFKENGMKTGLSILFHGFPGTGKTESVYQISKKTGRDIKMVIISESKSMWYGQSEKLIKKIFDDYKLMVQNCEVTPILLFNEIDGIFSTRKKIGSSSVDQTENSIQNIILQEMEDLTGILIGTTNLVKSLDKGFERRFLYKIEFKKPLPDVKSRIWKDKIPLLTDEECHILSERFDLSGGQIDNVSKKYLLKNILYGIQPDLEELLMYCRDESIEKREFSKIGYLK